MRKMIVHMFLTLDGVMQAPGRPDEDTSDGFKYGGWTAPYFVEADEAAGELMAKYMKPGLKFFPLTLGEGKKLFNNGTIPAAFTLTDSLVTSNGVIFANYKRAGEVKTGTVGA